MKRGGTLTIGVSGQSLHSKSVRAMMKQIHDEGAQATFLSCKGSKLPVKIHADFTRIDALVLMGNNLDIDPKHYIGRYDKNNPQQQVHPKTRSESTTPKGQSRARYEEAMLAKALAQGMPVLGICGGMQRINVHCGGTLHQHVPDLVGCDKHMQNKQGIGLHVPVVPVIIKENTLLANIAHGIKMAFATGHAADCPKVIMENSLHHQAVDIIAPGLRASALTDTIRLKDGTAAYLVEALEADPKGLYGKQFILGVQWHPEFGASSLGQHIVAHILTAARHFAKTRCVGKPLIFRSVQKIYTSKA